jgi:hypothetical protein
MVLQFSFRYVALSFTMLFNFKIAAPTHRLQYPFPETRENALPSHYFDKFEIQDTSDSVKMKNHLRIIQYFPSNGQRSRQGHGRGHGHNLGIVVLDW